MTATRSARPRPRRPSTRRAHGAEAALAVHRRENRSRSRVDHPSPWRNAIAERARRFPSRSALLRNRAVQETEHGHRRRSRDESGLTGGDVFDPIHAPVSKDIVDAPDDWFGPSPDIVMERLIDARLEPLDHLRMVAAIEATTAERGRARW